MYRLHKVDYIPATDKRGARVAITSDTREIIIFGYMYNSIADMAIAHLVERGISRDNLHKTYTPFDSASAYILEEV